MASWLQLVHLVLVRLVDLVLYPESLVMLAGVMLLVYWQYRRVAALETAFYGVPKNLPLRQLADSLIWGVVAGVAGSFIAVWSGIGVVQPPAGPVPVMYLWPVALALSLLHPRYICFAYATTVVGLSHLLLGWPRVDIPSLLALVALLHLVEAVLIGTGGASCATPLVMGVRPGEVLPGFQLQRFWPVPLVLPVAVAGVVAGSGDGVPMPEWWPIIRPDPLQVPDITGLVYGLVPVVVVMGYGDLALSDPPEMRSRRASRQLALYSLVLLALAAAGSQWRPALWMGTLFSGLAHEWLVVRSLRSQLSRECFLRPPGRGVGVLDVLPGSPAAAAGLRTGSVIVEVAGRPVNTRRELHEALVEAPAYLQLVFRNGWQLESVRIPRPEDGVRTLGAILMPEPDDPPMVALGTRSVLRTVGDLLARRLRRAGRR